MVATGELIKELKSKVTRLEQRVEEQDALIKRSTRIIRGIIEAENQEQFKRWWMALRHLAEDVGHEPE